MRWVVDSVGISDSPIIQRIAQLRVSQKVSGLDVVQQKEMELCLDWLVNHCWRQALLKNLSLMASVTNDIDWQHEICADIDHVEPGKNKKAGSKDTD